MATLKQKLSEAVLWAEAHPGDPHRIPLGKGLQVDLKVTKLTMLQLSRRDVYPAMREWQTVLACWPYPVDPNSVSPKPVKYMNRFYLMGHWPTPEKLVETPHG